MTAPAVRSRGQMNSSRVAGAPPGVRVYAGAVLELDSKSDVSTAQSLVGAGNLESGRKALSRTGSRFKPCLASVITYHNSTKSE